MKNNSMLGVSNMKQWCVGLCVMVMMVVVVHAPAFAETPVLIAMRHAGPEDKPLPQLAITSVNDQTPLKNDSGVAMIVITPPAMEAVAKLITTQHEKRNIKPNFLWFETLFLVRTGKRPESYVVSDKTFIQLIQIIAADYVQAQKPVPEGVANYQQIIKNLPPVK
jgi:hypothetical protein